MQITRRDVMAGALAAGAVGPAMAQAYPVRPVKIIVPFSAGGINDVVTRMVAGKLSEQMGRQFYVENIVGGSGNVGMAQAAKAAPDGYTLLTAFSSIVVNPGIFDKVPFDPLKDFDPVALIINSTTVIVVHPSLPVTSVSELIALIRANPGKYAYASGGTGTTSHLAGEQLRIGLKLDIVHVPFAGGAPAASSVVGGHTPIGLIAPAAGMSLIQDGRLRPLAVTAKARSAVLPNVATMAEAGYPDIEGDSFVGFVAPAGTPKDIIAALNREIGKAMAAPDMRERQLTLGNDPAGGTPDEFGARLRAELAVWNRVVKAANIRAG